MRSFDLLILYFSLYGGGVLWRAFLLLLSDFSRTSFHFIVCPYSLGFVSIFVTYPFGGGLGWGD